MNARTKSTSVMTLFLELERWALKAIDGKPMSSPIAVQVVQSILAVRREVFAAIQDPAIDWTTVQRIDAIAIFLRCVGRRFTIEAQPLKRLERKGWIEVDWDGAMSAKEGRPL